MILDFNVIPTIVNYYDREGNVSCMTYIATITRTSLIISKL